MSAPIKQVKRAQREAMSDQDVQKVLRAAEFAGLCIRLAAETGARRGELAALRWSSYAEGMLVINSQVVIAARGGQRTPEIQPTRLGTVGP